MFEAKTLSYHALALAAGLAISAPHSAIAAELKNCKTGLQLFPSDLSRVDPQLIPTLRALTANSGKRVERSISTMPAVRAAFRENFLKRAEPVPSDLQSVRVEERLLPGAPGAPQVRALVYLPKTSGGKRPALLDIHGGSYVLGFPEMNDLRNRLLSKQFGAVVVSVDYRLAPENPFPAALDDSYAALQWLASTANELGVDPYNIVVSGDSAGGGIAASLALLARDRGEIPLKAQILIYPNVDDRPYTVLDQSCEPGTGAPSNPTAAMYLGRQASQDVSAYAFAARAESLAGVAPAFIAVGDVDGLVEQDIAYARRLIQAGVPTELHIYPGAFHGFDYASEAKVTVGFLEDLKAALQRAWK